MVFENYSCEVIEDTYASSVTTIYNYFQPISQKNRAQFDVSRIILPLSFVVSNDRSSNRNRFLRFSVKETIILCHHRLNGVIVP